MIWLKENIFNIITTVGLVAGVFLTLNERVVRIEERVLSAQSRDTMLEKKIDELRGDVKDNNAKIDTIYKYIIEQEAKK